MTTLIARCYASLYNPDNPDNRYNPDRSRLVSVVVERMKAKGCDTVVEYYITI